MSVRPWGSVERLTHQQREITPPDLAEYLVERVRLLCNSSVIAALWLCERSPYLFMPGVEPWTPERDAMRYSGPWPIVAHPTCGPWGKLSWRSRQDPSHGIRAMALVHKFGGVVEQPAGSRLFREYGRPGSELETIWQSDFGHSAPKRTILYWYNRAHD